MLPERQAQQMVKALAASMTPETLRAVIIDLLGNDQQNEYQQGLADFATRQFARQLKAMTGETVDAMEMWIR